MMPANYAKHVSTRRTPQTESIPGKTQIKNRAGGFVFQIDNWSRLERFLVLGNDGGTYYASEREMSQENAQCVVDCANEDPGRTIETIASLSESGRAPKNDPAIFALALLAAHEKVEVRNAALKELERVCRIGTHLFQFVEAVQNFRGWGRGLRRAVGSWYTNKLPDKLAYQVTKYQQRNGWSHRDLLRLSHPSTPNETLTEVIKYAAGKEMNGSPVKLLEGVEAVKRAETEKQVVALINEFGLVREHIPTKWLNSVAVWDSMLTNMPMTAMVRNLGKMTSIGLLKPMSQAAMQVVAKMQDTETVKRSRIHPLAVLTALKIYSQGRGMKGSLSWSPVTSIVESLDDLFYTAFGNVEPANKRTLIGLDVSGSMGWGNIAGSPLVPSEAAAAMAMVTCRSEPFFQLMAFANTFKDVTFGKRSRLDDVINKTACMTFGATDCSLPMLYAKEHNIDVDTFMVITDNETWTGQVQPCQALQEYRQRTGIPAKLVVVGMTATDYSIADPNDAGMLDCVGMDLATPNIIADFSRGGI
jgi:60 kDa SS-A/Ro ribonucleoprotein